MRIEIFYKPELSDGRAERLKKSLVTHFKVKLTRLVFVDVYLLPEELNLSRDDINEIFVDQVAQKSLIDLSVADLKEFTGWNYLLEIAYKPGVTDPVALTACEAVLNWKNLTGKASLGIQTARQYLFYGTDLSLDQAKLILNSLYNPLIETAQLITAQEWQSGQRPPHHYPVVHIPQTPQVQEFDLKGMTDPELVAFSKEKLLALNLAEMKAIQDYFQREEFLSLRRQYGLKDTITDVELEMLAQTWSEHCKHKIFNALITYRENGTYLKINSLFKTYIKNTTAKLARHKHYLLSVFHDNSGVIAFDRYISICFKVETHNSPSALDPYGGAITGIVGVNRDILGTGRLARPFFNTNVLCFASPDTDPLQVPQGLLHPRRVLEGVHRGIIDGGNQSGIPTVAGAFLFDDSYLGKPLVYCGTGGMLPARLKGKPGHAKEIAPGDLAIMVGGRIGKDGIHGATFSSLALDETSPSSAVQIGDPITQKKMWDFLEEARDLGLFKCITDNGAGGLSSSLGEMAQLCGGVRIELDRCPLKYEGLAPWEILVSESQERMSLAVAPCKLKDFLDLAERRAVEATVVGEFTNTGMVEVRYQGQCVGLLDLEFLHNGLPQLQLEACFKRPSLAPNGFDSRTAEERAAIFYKILADHNICSREPLVRQYDHEVQALTIIKPFVGCDYDAPSDGAVLKPRYDSYRGITITHGINPRLSPFDTYDMAANAVDEAFRAHIALGGDPERVAALDNFCWPDPIKSADNPDGDYKLAQLVRACQGLADTCLAYGIPLISGKDSMKNEAYLGGKKIAVKPTLLISLIGYIDDIRHALTTDFKRSGDLIFLLGLTSDERASSIYESITCRSFNKWPQVDTAQALKLYRAFHKACKARLIASCHDLSDGGLAVALAESAFGAKQGFTISLDQIVKTNQAWGRESISVDAMLFSESAARLLVSIRPQHLRQFSRLMQGQPVSFLGEVTAERCFKIFYQDQVVLQAPVDEAFAHWQGGLREKD